MNITMLTIGSMGDVRPFVLLGRELRSRGHTITIATFSGFEKMILDAGLGFFPLSGNAAAFMASIMAPDTNGLTYLPHLWKGLKQYAPELIRDMDESCRHANAMVVNFFGSVYYSIAEKYGIPCIQTYYFPMDPNSAVPISSIRNMHLGAALNRQSYKLGYMAIGTVEKLILSPWRKENRLDPRKASSHPNYQIGNHTVPVIYAISPCLFPRPAEWGPAIRMSGFWFDDTPVSWKAPDALESFLSAGDRPVYIGFGSMVSGDMNRLLTILLRAIHASGIRAIVSLGDRRTDLHSTRNVLFASYIPHDWIFPRVQAVVHHGGAGTTAAGLRYGLPTLIIPFAGDQPFWGDRVFRSGCGPKPVNRKSLTVHSLTRSLIDLTRQEKYAVHAAQMAAAMKQEHGVQQAADMVESDIMNWGSGACALPSPSPEFRSESGSAAP